jgi:threonine dehydrogenase-like Zn-dependent dehydrogenase
MRAVRNTEQGIRVTEVAGPAAPDGVRVSVAGSGICGSDLHLASFGPSSVTLGHEFGGRLDDGTPVAVVPVLTCGRCEPCRSGHEQLCGQAFGGLYGMSLDGGMADEVWVDPRCTRVVPEAVPVEDACLVEPLAVALHGVDRAGVEPGMRVLVIGAGPIGLCAIAVARHRGATVDVSARHQNRLSAGARLGAGTALGSDYDVVLDAAGTQSSVDQAVGLARAGGTVGILANFWEPVSLSMAFLIKEVSLVPSFMYGHHHGAEEFDDAVGVLEATPDLAPTVITHRFSLDDAAEAFRVAGDRSTDAIKVVLHP